MAFAQRLGLQWRALIVGGRDELNPNRPVESLGRAVLHGHFPVDPVPLAREVRLDRLGDVDAAVALHADVGVEVLDLERALSVEC